MGKFKNDKLVRAALVDTWKAGDRSYKVEANVLRSLGRLQPLELVVVKQALKRDSHREVIRQAALGVLARHPSGEAVELITDWVTPDRPRRCRMAAISALGERVVRPGVSDESRKKVIEVLTTLLSESGPRIRTSALGALRRLGSEAGAAEEVIASLAENDPEGRVRVAARDALKALKTAKTATGELDRLRGELETLRKRNQDLADRLKKLEAK